jgi:hypothetical protein
VLGLGRKAAESAILLLALYAAVFIPLGERTLWQHAVAILSTHEAKRAGRELTQAGTRMLFELTDFEARPVRGKPQVPPLPQPQRARSRESDEP